MQNKDLHDFRIGLNKDDKPEDLQPGEYTDALNMRVGSSKDQHGVGIAETLQGEIEVLISVAANIIYYGEPIGGEFIYEGYEEISVGSQVWMKKNWDADYPGSKIYDDLDSNKSIYGRLYTHIQAMADNFCPPGWRMPTENDIDELLEELGGEMLAGGKMKEFATDHWLFPNSGADNSSGLNVLPGGKFDLIFSLIGQNGFLWLQDESAPGVPVAKEATYVGPSSFIAEWEATDGADGYLLDISFSSIFDSFLGGYEGLNVGNATSKPISGVPEQTNYYYRLRAYNEIGVSSSSSVIAVRTSINTETYWTDEKIAEVFLFLGETSNIAGDKFYNQVLGSTDFITVGGVPGAETYICPDTSAYRAADTDNIWFKQNLDQRLVTFSELIGFDLQRTPVQYDHFSPNYIRKLGIIRDDVVLTEEERVQLHHFFKLPIMWSGFWVDEGYEKSNRPLDEFYFWEPEIDYEQELLDYIEGLATALSYSEKVLLNDFIITTKSIFSINNLSEFFDTLHIDASETEESSLINMAKNDHHGTKGGAVHPVHTPLEGNAGNGVNGYIDMDYTPSVDKVHFLHTGGSAGVYLRTDLPNAAYKYAIAARRLRIGTGSSGSVIQYGIYSNASPDVAEAPTKGLYIVTKTTGFVEKLIKDGVLIHSGVMTEQSTDDYKVFKCCGNSSNSPAGFVNSQIALSFTSGYMSEGQALAFTNAFETYMIANGKGVL